MDLWEDGAASLVAAINRVVPGDHCIAFKKMIFRSRSRTTWLTNNVSARPQGVLPTSERAPTENHFLNIGMVHRTRILVYISCAPLTHIWNGFSLVEPILS